MKTIAGYTDMATKEFIPVEDAFTYATEQIDLSAELQEEVATYDLEPNEIVEWFFSGNYLEETA